MICQKSLFFSMKLNLHFAALFCITQWYATLDHTAILLFGGKEVLWGREPNQTLLCSFKSHSALLHFTSRKRLGDSRSVRPPHAQPRAVEQRLERICRFASQTFFCFLNQNPDKEVRRWSKSAAYGLLGTFRGGDSGDQDLGVWESCWTKLRSWRSVSAGPSSPGRQWWKWEKRGGVQLQMLLLVISCLQRLKKETRTRRKLNNMQRSKYLSCI